MSQRLISLDPALKRLRDEGYDISVKDGYVVVRNVPYVNAQRQVARGVLAYPVTGGGTAVGPPVDHTARFAGGPPCTSDGAEYTAIINNRIQETVADGVVATYYLSRKPPSGSYADHYEKVTTYVDIFGVQAQALDPSSTARVYRPVAADGTEDSPFLYLDTASSRAGINATSGKLSGQRIAIVGLGGTGSHILDRVARTWVREIHLLDDDRLYSHNAFRMAGAVSEADLDARPTKVGYLQGQYSLMRTGVVAHEERVDHANVHKLAAMDFVFLTLTDGSAKKVIVDFLEQKEISFIDCGMGLTKVDDALLGQIRVTTSIPNSRTRARSRMSFGDGEIDDEYSQNIQIAELNSLNADLAVIKWKKLNRFYVDFDREHNAIYVLDGNTLINDEKDENAD